MREREQVQTPVTDTVRASWLVSLCSVDQSVFSVGGLHRQTSVSHCQELIRSIEFLAEESQGRRETALFGAVVLSPLLILNVDQRYFVISTSQNSFMNFLMDHQKFMIKNPVYEAAVLCFVCLVEWKPAYWILWNLDFCLHSMFDVLIFCLLNMTIICTNLNFVWH